MINFTWAFVKHLHNLLEFILKPVIFTMENFKLALKQWIVVNLTSFILFTKPN
jgi:hypothetical protein